MIYVKLIFGGLAALLSCAVLVIWSSKPKPRTIGTTGLPLFAPRFLLLEAVIFMVGFLIVWLLVRQR